MESSDTYQDFHGGWWGLCYSALPKIIKTGFTAISLIYFFTAGPDEVSASTCVDTL
jgi:ribosome-binding ATPase YchF (GTP1/OBG family)